MEPAEPGGSAAVQSAGRGGGMPDELHSRHLLIRVAEIVAVIALVANSLLPAGGAGGLALGVWALHQAGMPTGRIARRSVAFFVITSAANFLVLIVVGLGVFVGVLTGRASAVLTLVPALVTALGALLIGLSPKLLRALGERGRGEGRDGNRGRVERTIRGWLEAAAD